MSEIKARYAWLHPFQAIMGLVVILVVIGSATDLLDGIVGIGNAVRFVEAHSIVVYFVLIILWIASMVGYWTATLALERQFADYELRATALERHCATIDQTVRSLLLSFGPATTAENLRSSIVELCENLDQNTAATLRLHIQEELQRIREQAGADEDQRQ